MNAPRLRTEGLLYEVVWSAAAFNLVTWLSEFTAALLFGVENLPGLGALMVTSSLLIWVIALVVLVVRELINMIPVVDDPAELKPPPAWSDDVMLDGDLDAPVDPRP